MRFKSLREQIRTTGTKVLDTGAKVLNATRKIPYYTAQREIVRVRKSRREKYPNNLGIHIKDVNRMTDF